jgi:hypothetical protein
VTESLIWRRFEADSPIFPTNLSTGFVDKRKAGFPANGLPGIFVVHSHEPYSSY